MSDHIEVLRGLLREAVPYLRDAGEPFEDDGGNEPLELSRRIEDALESDAALAAMGGQAEAVAASDDALPEPFPRVHGYDPSGDRRTVTVEWLPGEFVQYVRFGDRRTWKESPPARYSLDADRAGIRARVADCIAGVLQQGAHGINQPPSGHWLEPFWHMARADAHPAPQQPEAQDYPECSGNPKSCPENEGYGCCGGKQPGERVGGLLSGDGSLTYAGQRQVVEYMTAEIRDAIALLERIQQRAEAIDCQPTTPPPSAVPEGMVLAYGYLWHAGNPSEVRGDNLVLPPEIAAAKARLELRDLLTTDQRCRAIDKVRAMLAAAQQPGEGA